MAFTSGGKSRYSGTMALNNMSGAIEGYRKGRKDLFEREMKEFEKNIKSTIENNNVIKQRLQNAQSKLAVDRDAAMSDLKVLQDETFDEIEVAKDRWIAWFKSKNEDLENLTKYDKNKSQIK